MIFCTFLFIIVCIIKSSWRHFVSWVILSAKLTRNPLALKTYFHFQTSALNYSASNWFQFWLLKFLVSVKHHHLARIISYSVAQITSTIMASMNLSSSAPTSNCSYCSTLIVHFCRGSAFLRRKLGSINSTICYCLIDLWKSHCYRSGFGA